MSRRIHFKNLDALRFFAAFVVLSYHLSIWLPFPNNSIGKYCRIIMSMDSSAGEAGVKFFFVLSGFLITYLMFEEDASDNGFSVSQFYLRRILRIWPLYYFTLALGFVAYPLVAFKVGFKEQASPLLYSLFGANFDNMFTKPQAGILGVQWSVSVEEQFYLAWPILFFFSGKGIKFIWSIVILFFASLFFIMAGGHPYNPLSCVRELSLGAMAAWLCFFRLDTIKALFGRTPRTTIVLIYLLGLFVIMANFQLNKHFPFVWRICSILMPLFFVFILLEQIYSPNSFYKAGKFEWFTYLGKRSYSIYLLHMAGITISLMMSNSLVPQLVVALVATYLLSEFSYRLIEMPFLRLKSKVTSKKG